MKHSKFSRIALAVALTVGASATAVAQETSSSIRGTVLTANGQSVSGATVTITDTRTGAVKVVESNQTGSYTLRGMRVGGPYIVEVVDSAGTKKVDNVFLTLGETLSLNLGLEDNQSIESIVVTGSRVNSAFGSSGPVANFGLEDLEAAPAINRDIKDLIKIDPRVYIDEARSDSIQCAGANSRFNSLTVDGIRTNDNFGLGSSGYPTIRIPFSYDSIDQVSVELSPFDVQYGGFTACNINAVTKSGENEFHGGAFFDYTNDSLRGDSLEGNDITTGSFNERRYGFNVGGALIEDKLFFFTSYEKLEGATLFDRGTGDSNAAVNVQGVSQAQIDRIAQIARDVYGYEPGEFVNSIPVEDEKIMAKLDWQINENHRASLAYNYNDGDIIRESDGDANEYEFSNHYYTQRGEFESYVVSLYSDWTDNFSTEIRLGTSEFEATVTPLGGTDFGEVQITTNFDHDGNGETSRATVYLGADDSRHANKLIYENDTIVIAGTYLLGDHVITGGYEYENLDVFNLFIQEAEGEYRFESIDDFEAGRPSRITYENAAFTNNPADAAAEFSYQINTAYIQDEYFWLDQDMTITFGLRYDWYTSDDLPEANQGFQDLYGFSNQQNLDGLDLLQPRLGVNWVYNDQLELRGGVGLYSGGNPNVWISNNYSNNGVIQVENRLEGLDEDGATDTLFTIPHTGGGRPIYDIPQELFDDVAAGIGRAGGINVQDPNFEIPHEWKFAIGATYTFDGDYVLMADLLHSEKEDAAIIRDLSRERVGTAPDGRPIYDSANGRRQDFMLTNVEGDSGSSTTFSLALSKSHDFGLDWSVAYAFTSAEDVSPMTSSVAFSNYISPAVSDSENPGVATSNFEIPHRITLRLTYTQEFFDGYETSFTVFGTANEGRPYSYVFDGDLNGGFGSSVNFIDHNLLYVPLVDDPNVVYSDEFTAVDADTGMSQLDLFNQFIAEEGLTRGQIMERNSLNSDWFTKFDIKIEQDLPGFVEGHTASAFFIIENFGNLLNDDWGVMYETGFPRAQEVIGGSINDSGQFVYDEFIEPARQTIVADASLWEVRFGVKYNF